MSSQQRYETLEAEADSLRQQLRESELQYAHTKDMYNNVSNQLVRFNRFQDEVKALKENAVKMSDVVAAKAAEAVNLKEETESLQEMLKAIEEELERRKIEVNNMLVLLEYTLVAVTHTNQAQFKTLSVSQNRSQSLVRMCRCVPRVL